MTTLDPLAVANGGAPFRAPATADEAREYIRANGIEFLFAQFVDMHGKPNAKLVPARLFDGLMEDGAGFAGFAAGAIGQFPHDPDLAAMPDVRSFTPLPWKPGVARLACDVHVEGEEWPYCPRTILRRHLRQAGHRPVEAVGQDQRGASRDRDSEAVHLRLFVRPGEDMEVAGSGVVGAGDQPLEAVDHVLVAVEHRLGVELVGI